MVDNNLNTQKPQAPEIYLKNNYEAKDRQCGIYLADFSGFESIAAFEKKAGTHNLYALEMNINDEFPLTHVLQCFINDKAPFITINADSKNRPSFVQNLNLAREFGTLDIPIYVNLIPYSSNGWPDTESYKEAWEDTAHVFKTYAPNIKVIWSIYSDDNLLIENVLPSETYADHIGLMYYGQIENKGEDFFNALDRLYPYTQTQIYISALGISHYSTSDHAYKTKEAAQLIQHIYEDLALSYPKVGTILYSDKDLANNAPANVICNNYRVTQEEEILKPYKEAIEDYCSAKQLKYFKTAFKAKFIDQNYYIPKDLLDYYALPKDDMMEESFIHQGYIKLDTLNKFTYKIENNRLYLDKN